MGMVSAARLEELGTRMVSRFSTTYRMVVYTAGATSASPMAMAFRMVSMIMPLSAMTSTPRARPMTMAENAKSFRPTTNSWAIFCCENRAIMPARRPMARNTADSSLMYQPWDTSPHTMRAMPARNTTRIHFWRS